MNNFINLVKINFKSVFIPASNNASKLRKYFGPMILAICLIASAVYSYIISLPLHLSGAYFLLVILATLASTILGVILFISSANNLLYKGKDTSILFSLPIKKHIIMLSKFATLLLLGYLYQAVIMIPPVVMYFVYSGFNFVSLIYFVVGFFLVLLMPFAISVVLSCAISLLTRKLKHKNLFTITALFAFFGLFLYLYLNIDFENFINAETEKRLTSLITYIPTLSWFVSSIINQSFLHFALNVGLSVALFAFSLWFVNLTFFKVCSFGIVQHENNKPLAYTQKKINVSLLKKDLKQFFSSPIYVFNFLFGPLVLIAVSIYLCFNSGMLSIISQMLPVKYSVACILALAMCFVLSTCCTTCIGISVERKSFNILKSLPINFNQIWLSKILLNLTLTIPAVLFASVIITISCSLSVVDFIFCISLPVAFALFNSAFGMMINILLPNMNSVNDTMLVKQSLNSFVAIIAPMLLIMLFSVLYFTLLINILSIWIFMLALLLFILIVTSLTYWFLFKNAQKRILSIY